MNESQKMTFELKQRLFCEISIHLIILKFDIKLVYYIFLINPSYCYQLIIKSQSTTPIYCILGVCIGGLYRLIYKRFYIKIFTLLEESTINLMTKTIFMCIIKKK